MLVTEENRSMFPSLEDIAIVKCAVGVCVCSELKREILCAPGSVYDRRKRLSPCNHQQRWKEIVENKARRILGKLCMPKKLQKTVMYFVLPIGMRMLIWAEYHEGIIGFSREYSIHFLNSSVFTQQGIIDNKKAAEELIKDNSLNIKQKYKLASLYCIEEHILALHKEVMEQDKKAHMLPEIGQPALITFWSYYLMGEIDKLRRGKTTDEYRLEKAIQSGSKAAVEYCFSKTDLKDTVVNAAVETVKNKIKTKNDSIIFENRRYKNCGASWVPNDYYVDILCFLLSKMSEDERIMFLRKDIEGDKYPESFEKHSRVLKYFLNWPYQDNFMKNARLMWEFLSYHNYSALLLKICRKIEPREEKSLKYAEVEFLDHAKEESLKHGEEKTYNYRGLLNKFWCQSPEHFKKYVLSDETGDSNIGVVLLIRLLTLENFTHEDKKNVRLILASATDIEKEIIMSSKTWRSCYIKLMRKEKWKVLDRFMSNCFTSEEHADEFKRVFTSTERAQFTCIEFVEKRKWDAVASFMNWCALPEVEINKLKKKLIHSKHGKQACVDLILQDNGLEAVDRFIRWFFPSEEEVKAFKKELIFDDIGILKCAHLIQLGQVELANEFINTYPSSEEEVKELKKKVAYGEGGVIFETLIPVDWEAVENYLTWFFSSEEEINEFKKKRLFKMAGVKIHFNMTECNEWKEAETFFAWLGLSAEEIKELKTETVFNYLPFKQKFTQMMFDVENDEYDDSRSKKAIEQFLRWYLTDKETILEFKNKIRCDYHFYNFSETDFKILDLIIKQLLRDLDEEQKGAKRKCDTFSFSKKQCNLKLENNEADCGL